MPEIPADHWLNQVAGAEMSSDGAIIEQFRRWRVEQRTICDLLPRNTPTADAAMEAASARSVFLEQQIFAAAAVTGAGLAVKAFLLVHLLRSDKGETRSDSLRPWGEDLTLDDLWQRSMMADAARFLPELAPLVGGAAVPDPSPAPPQLPRLDTRDALPGGNGPEPGRRAAPATEAQRQVVLAELRRRGEAVAAEYDTALPAGDAGLIEAERRRLALVAARGALCREFRSRNLGPEEDAVLEPNLDALETRLYDLITETEPDGPAGIAVKLRQLRGMLLGGPEPTSEDVILGQCLDALMAPGA